MTRPACSWAVACALLIACEPGDPEAGGAVGDGVVVDRMELSTTPGSPCDPSWIREGPGHDEVHIGADASPLCELTFEPVVTLGRSAADVSPRPPIAVLPDGRYASGTFTPGKIAIWDERGGLSHLVGEGEGEGPGEFVRSVALVPLEGDRIAVLTGTSLVQVFSIDGKLEASVRTATSAGVREAVASGESEMVFVIGGFDPDVVRATLSGGRIETEEFTLPPATASGAFLAATEEHVWLAPFAEYGVWQLREADRWVRRLTRMRDDFPSDAGARNEASLFDLEIGENGVIWVLARVEDPSAPGDPMPTRYRDAEHALEVAGLYHDNLIEVVGLDGTLLASKRYDDPRDVPTPASVDRWYRVDANLLETVTVYRPRLTPLR